MSQAPHDDLAGYALGELSEDDRRAFELQMASDPVLAREAGELRTLVTRVDDVELSAFEPVTPPPLRLEPQTVAASASASAPAPVRAPRRERRKGVLVRLFGAGLRQPALAAVLLALVFAGGLGAGILLSGGSDDGGTRAASGSDVTLSPVGNLQPSATGNARLEAGGRDLRVTVSGLDPNNNDDFYEAWLMDAKQGLVSLGSFRVGADGRATIDVPVPVDPGTFPVVDISLERADGVPGHSGKSVLRAELT